EELLGEWSALAEACLQVALDFAVERCQRAGEWPRSDSRGFVVFALGRLGGREMHIASDLDLVYVCDPPPDGEVTYQQYEALAREFHEILQASTREGILFDIDLRLRPEGRRGAFVTHLDTCRSYFRERAETWEKQAWSKARRVAGD